MQIPKQQIMELIRTSGEPGDESQADQAEQELPEQVDTDKSEHQSLLQKFGVNPQDLVSKLGGSFGL